LALGLLATAPTVGEPTLAKTTALLFGVPAPNTGLLIGFECVLEAFFTYRARGANGTGFLDVANGRTGCANREEYFRVAVPTGGQFPPVGQCEHAASFSSDPGAFSYLVNVNAFTSVVPTKGIHNIYVIPNAQFIAVRCINSRGNQSQLERDLYRAYLVLRSLRYAGNVLNRSADEYP
jgi:hypothetical protein